MISGDTETPAAIVAIPAHDEAERIGACLAALAMQRTATGSPLPAGAFAVLVLANNCRDGTADAARAFAERAPFALHVVGRTLPQAEAHAGGARRVAMDLAADRLARSLGGDGIVMTTDADSRVGPSWVAANFAAFDTGVDAVAGYIDAEPSEYLALGRAFLDRGRLEDRFLALAAELYGRLDPRRHDPWPNHRVHSGASFALKLSAYRAIGGLPRPPLGEDAALAVALERSGLLIRHSLDAVVTTSCRFDSRARGGAGDTMKLRHAEPDAPCDDDLEPAAQLFRRARCRGALRRLHEIDRLGDGAGWRHRLRLPSRSASRLAHEGKGVPFAQLWAKIEATSPTLRRAHLLRPSNLPAEIARLERLLRWMNAERTEDRAVGEVCGAPPPMMIAAKPLR